MRNRRNLSIDEKVAIIHSIIVDLNTMTDVAKEYRVTVACVSNLVRVAKKVPGFLRELQDKDYRKQESKDKIFKIILDMLQNGAYLSSVRFIRDQIQKLHKIEIKESQMKQLMVQDFGMRYKKVKEISYTSNDDKNLILRQQFAKTFINLDLNKKVIINIDESWINMTDFRRRRWTFPNIANSVPKKQV